MPGKAPGARQFGEYETEDITLATSLMCSDYPGASLIQVIPHRTWRRGRAPRFTFVLAYRDPEVVTTAVQRYKGATPHGLPVNNTGEYDENKRHLSEKMAIARAAAILVAVQEGSVMVIPEGVDVETLGAQNSNRE